MAKTGSLEQPFGFSTKRYFAELGLVYYGFRYYSPAMAKWITRDPIGETGGVNLYALVLNNPVNWVDPWGFSAACETNCVLKGCLKIVSLTHKVSWIKIKCITKAVVKNVSNGVKLVTELVNCTIDTVIKIKVETIKISEYIQTCQKRCEDDCVR